MPLIAKLLSKPASCPWTTNLFLVKLPKYHLYAISKLPEQVACTKMPGKRIRPWKGSLSLCMMSEKWVAAERRNILCQNKIKPPNTEGNRMPPVLDNGICDLQPRAIWFPLRPESSFLHHIGIASVTLLASPCCHSHMSVWDLHQCQEFHLWEQMLISVAPK